MNLNYKTRKKQEIRKTIQSSQVICEECDVTKNKKLPAIIMTRVNEYNALYSLLES